MASEHRPDSPRTPPAGGRPEEFFLGVCHPLPYTDDGDVRPEGPAVVERRLELMRRAGVRWVSCDMPFPFEGKAGRASRAFRNFVELATAWNDAGFKVLGVTPYPAGFEGGWRIDAGRPGSSRFLAAYEEACRFLAEELGERVGAWQIANQLNLERFRRPMSAREAVEFLKRGGAGARRGNPSALVGVNMFGFYERALLMYSRLYPNDEVEFDYAGTNGFPGTFEAGSPEDWCEKTALVHELTGKPVIVLEFGYPSRGEAMSPEERAGERTHHELRKLPHVWGPGRTPEAQASYLERAAWTLANSGVALGAMWFCWSDRAVCWNCRAGDCPAGTSHGLVDVEGDPKPSYHAFARAARGEFDVDALCPELAAFPEADPRRVRLELGRRVAENRALSARVDILRRMLASRSRRLDEARRSLPFRLWRLFARSLSRLARRRAEGGAASDG